MTETAPSPFYPHRPINGGHPEILGLGFGLSVADWDIEPKLDGCRVICHLPTGQVFNRHGSPFASAAALEPAIKKLQKKMSPWATVLNSQGDPLFEWVDCEALINKGHENGSGSLVVIDVVMDETLEKRAEYFHHIKAFPLTGCAAPNSLYRMSRAPLRKGKQIINRIKRLNDDLFEGVVLKKHGSRYSMNWTNAAKESSSWIKQRFMK